MKQIACLVFSVALGALAPANALATCGTGQPPSYDDVSAVMLKQNGCGGTIQLLSTHPQRRWYSPTIDCSAFWALFWSAEPTDYSQFNLKGGVGSYHLATTVAEARAVLEKDRFFLLSPPDVSVTDTAEAVLSVLRCGVITRIREYKLPPEAGVADIYGGNRDFDRLWNDLEALVSSSPKTKTSVAPSEFVETLLFDP